MSRHFRRREPTLREGFVAATLAAGVAAVTGAVAFYVTRTLLARETLEEPSRLEKRARRRTAGDGGGGPPVRDGNGDAPPAEAE